MTFAIWCGVRKGGRRDVPSDCKPSKFDLVLPSLYDRRAIIYIDCTDRVTRGQLADSHAGFREPLQALAREQSEAGLRHKQTALLEDVEKRRKLGSAFDDVESRGREEVRVPPHVDDLGWAGPDVVDHVGPPLPRDQNDLAGVRRQVGGPVSAREARRVDPSLWRAASHRDFQTETLDLDDMVGSGPGEVRDVGLLEAEGVRVDAGQYLEGIVQNLHFLGRGRVAGIPVRMVGERQSTIFPLWPTRESRNDGADLVDKVV